MQAMDDPELVDDGGLKKTDLFSVWKVEREWKDLKKKKKKDFNFWLGHSP